MRIKQAQPVWMENVVPLRRTTPRLSTEEIADNLRIDLEIIADRISHYEQDLAALKRLRDTKAEQLEICIRALGRQA